MCDYSLVALRTRLAVDGEELVTYRFPTGSLGLTAPAELELYKPEPGTWWSSQDARKVACAVCIPHGARLRLRDIPERLQQKLGVSTEEDVIFIQTSAEPGRHRDGVRFANGQEILLQRLAEGQHASVVSVLPSATPEEWIQDTVLARTVA
jgi:hypothetical protein